MSPLLCLAGVLRKPSLSRIQFLSYSSQVFRDGHCPLNQPPHPTPSGVRGGQVQPWVVLDPLTLILALLPEESQFNTTLGP